MNGRLLVSILVGCGVLAGGAMYYLQVYAYYDQLDPGTVDVGVAATGMEAIDSTSSPIRFRACFETSTPADTLEAYPEAVPLNAPGWFSCFEASQIGEDLAAGRATAAMGIKDVIWGIDRVLAIYPDGRGFAWQQINRCGSIAFDGDPLPPDCPSSPGESE